MRMQDGLKAEIELVVRGEHFDPHHVLGRHPTEDGGCVRAYRPAALSVRLCCASAPPVQLERIHPAGVFAGPAPACAEPYRLEVAYEQGTYSIHDPYQFSPTVGELDCHLIGEGRHEEIYRVLGAQPREIDGVAGISFAVWAPNARSVRVIGEFNGWDGRLHAMRVLGGSGIWEIFLPCARIGQCYKFEILSPQGFLLKKADPYARGTEAPPATSGVIHRTHYKWQNEEWLEKRRSSEVQARPMSIYEVHLGSWRRGDDGETLGYREIGEQLADYCRDMGFTHVELLPIAEHPFGPSWGYQVSYQFAPTARYGEPDDFKYLIDRLHEKGVGVIMDWVPAHFPRDTWALARYDGTALYEHDDPRQGEHPDWGTLVFNYGRNEVRNYMLGAALHWLGEYRIDGLRVDAVAAMLYLDYSRKEGEWIPNAYGGRENLEAISFLRELNAVVHGKFPGVLMIAEESTAWPAVSRPTWMGGLGFGFKWNMGWMHDTLQYFSKDPIHRRFHHHDLTFALMYAWHENFVLPLSHDEVVHGKGSLVGKMPGDRWQQLANLRALYGWMWAHPGKQLLFMGGEFAQSAEWDHAASLDWHLLQYEEHQGVQRTVRDLNHAYLKEPALWSDDFASSGFSWIDANNSDHNVFAFLRRSRDEARVLVCIANLAPIVRRNYRVGLPHGGRWREIMNTDSGSYGGSNTGNAGLVSANDEPWHGMPNSARFVLPPLGVLWLIPEKQEEES